MAVRLDWSFSSAVSVESMLSGSFSPGPGLSAPPRAPGRRGCRRGPREEEVARRARSPPVIGRGSRPGSCPRGSRASVRTGRRHGTVRDRARFVPRASRTSTRSPVSTERSSAVSESTSTPAGRRCERGHARRGRAVDEERVRERRDLPRSSSGRSPPGPLHPGRTGRSAPSSRARNDRRHRRHPGDLERATARAVGRLVAEHAGCDAEVGADHELGSAAFAAS